MKNYWSTDSILNHQTEATPPREIYQAVCNAIGAYFIQEGFKYARSTPKIWTKDQDHKLEIVFSSSGSNYAGGIVNLEINAYLYSLEIIKNRQGKGLLNTALTPLIKKLEGAYDLGTQVVRQINGEELVYKKENQNFNELIYNRNVNLYGIDEELFGQIIQFIEIRQIQWLKDIINPDRTLELLDKCGSRAKLGLIRTDFLDYFKMKYPKLAVIVEEKLRNV